ncbi:MAG: LptF/LptG family permease [Rickettsiaceae bacterium]|nr:LptF/LptG family permease [Rickettsiaceae bacterium]
MLIYQKYIIKSIFPHLLFAAGILSIIIWLSQVLRLAYLFETKIFIFEFITITLLILPSLIHSILPLALLYSFIFSYNNLKANKEIVAFKSAGLSIRNLLHPFIIVSLLVFCISIINASILMPYSYNLLKQKIQVHKNRFATAAIEEGMFTQLSKKLVIFLNKKISTTQFKGIILFDYGGDGPPSILLASEGKIIDQSGIIKFNLLDGVRQSFSSVGNLEILSFDKFNVKLNNSQIVEGNSKKRDMNEKYIWELLWNNNTDEGVKLKHIAEGNNRIAWSLMCIILPLVSVVVLLRNEYRRMESILFTLKAVACSLFFALIYFIILSANYKYHILNIALYINFIFGLIFIEFFSLGKNLDSKVPV